MNPAMSDRLILFTKFPEPGHVKTRLIPALGAEGAANLHRKLTEHCVEQMAPMTADSNLALTIFYAGGSDTLMQDWFPHIPLVEQCGKDLGQRMAAAFIHARNRGDQRIVLFGADCPGLNNDLICKALNLLDTHDLILGPTFDGGYYLIGISTGYQVSNLFALLADTAWGTAEVLQQTLDRTKAANSSYALLPPLNDIDRPEDLEYFNHHTNS